MITSEKKLENARMEIQVEVPENRVEMEYKSVYNKIRAGAQVDGFRKGKAPLELVEKKYREVAEREVAENILKSVYMEAVTEKQYRPIAPPEFDFEKTVRGKSFSFKAVFDIMPEVKLAEYKKLSAEERSCEISDDDVNREIETLRERNANISKREDGAGVEKGNLVKIRLKRIDNIDESEVEKTEFKDYSIIAGKSEDEYGFDKDIMGMKAGEDKEVKIKYPKDYTVKDLAGQTARYIIKIDEISLMNLPSLDDEFAKDLGKYESLDDLRKEIRGNLENYVRDKAQSEAKNSLVRQVISSSTFDIPNSMVEKEMESIFLRLQQRMGYYAQDINQFTSMLGIEPGEFSQRMRDEAVANIKSTLVLSEIGRVEDLKVSEKKFLDVIEAIARKNNTTVEQLEKIMAENNTRENIEADMILDEAMDFVYRNATLKKAKPVSLGEFIKKQ